jgi:hypothetical protein
MIRELFRQTIGWFDVAASRFRFAPGWRGTREWCSLEEKEH